MDEHYIEEFKKDYEFYGKYNLKVQIPHLYRLADYYADKYELTGEWTDCLKAQSLYNSIGSRDPDKIHWHQKAFDIQQKYWKGSTTLSITEDKDLTTSLQHQLQSVRRDTREELKKTDSTTSDFTDDFSYDEELIQLFTLSIQTISVQCTDKMVDIAHRIMHESVGVMSSKPPCPFTAIAIGSLARGEATPYSDLEYMFLIEKRSPEIVTYFENLAMTTYFAIGNLRETELSYIFIEELENGKWFKDTSKNGFKIDGLSPGAGNIPTGNGNPQTKNHFIVTPHGLVTRYAEVLNNPIEKEALRGDFTAMLAYMKSIYSYQSGDRLLDEVKSEIAKLIPNENRENVNTKMLENDMKKFDFKPSARLRKKGFTVDVKKEIYRFPSILIYDLSIIYGCVGETVWETVELLHSRGHISASIRTSILFQLAFACYVRLSTYLYHDSHDDRVSVAMAVADSGPAEGEQRRWPMPSNLLFTLCNFMIPLKQSLAESWKTSHDVLCQDGCFVSSMDWPIKVQTLYFCCRVNEAMGLLEKECDLDCPAQIVAEIIDKYGETGVSICKDLTDILSFCERRQTAQNILIETKKLVPPDTLPPWLILTEPIVGAEDIIRKFVLAKIAYRPKGVCVAVPSLSDLISVHKGLTEVVVELIAQTGFAPLKDGFSELNDLLYKLMNEHCVLDRISDETSVEEIMLHYVNYSQILPSFMKRWQSLILDNFLELIRATLRAITSEKVANSIMPTPSMIKIFMSLSDKADLSKLDAEGLKELEEFNVYYLGVVLSNVIPAILQLLPTLGTTVMDHTKMLPKDLLANIRTDFRSRDIDLKQLSPRERLQLIRFDKNHFFKSVYVSAITLKLGTIYHFMGDYELAQAYYDKCQEIMLDKYGRGAAVPELAKIHIYSAMNVQKMGELDRVHAELVTAKTIYQMLKDDKMVDKVDRMIALVDNGETITQVIDEKKNISQTSMVHDDPE